MRAGSLLVLGLVTLTGQALAGGKSFMGQDAPAIGAREFLNRPERTEVGEYKGEVLLLEFFATW